MNESEANPNGGRISRLPVYRDLWAWVSAMAVLPIVFLTRGNPRGEPFAEDFDFLKRAILEGGGSWLDGGGSLSFWRPIPHQLYYQTFGNLVLEHPGRIGAIHIALLALGSILLYRVFRRAWSGPMAAAAASFPLLAESTRTMICWTGHIVEVGVFLFIAIAVHEAAHRRAWSAVPAMFAALLCKELAIVGVLLLPFIPGVFSGDRGARRRWIVICAVVTSAWAVAYLWVRRHAGLELPHGLESNPALLATPIAEKLSWAIWNSLRAVFSMARAARLEPTAWAAGVALAAALLVIVRSPAARERFRAARGWIAWGGVWAVLSWAALAPIFPFWAPNRSQLGSVGFGVSAVALASVVHPAAPAVLVAARLGMLALSPRTPPAITERPEDRGAFMDYPKLSRLQQLMVASRHALLARYPTLPHGSLIGFHGLPLSTEYAFGGPLAFQVWYRDTTLGFTTVEACTADPSLPVRAFLSYQPHHRPQIVVVEPVAQQWLAAGVQDLREGRWVKAITEFDRADSAQRDRAAMVFRGDVAGRRAYCLAHLARWEEAESQARFATNAAAEDVVARYVMAAALATRRQNRAAMAELDTLLAIAPGHKEAIDLRRALEVLVANHGR